MTAGSAHPKGTHAPSFVPPWVKDAVFYQIFPERFANGDPSNDPPGTEPWGGAPTPRNYFGGDLRGILQRLGYLSSLGITAIYLNPIFASNTNHKYQTTDYLRIDPHFGDEATFRELLDACHARGIRVILDGVFNHTGVDFFAFADVKKHGASSQYKNWYFFKGFPVGPVRSPNYQCWWGYGSLPKLNTGNADVRRYIFNVTRHWLELGIDGWRLDVPNEIPHEFWIEWRRLVKSINPDAYIVGEIWEDGAPWLEGDQFDAVMNYRFRKACVDFFATGNASPSQFDAALARQRSDFPDSVNLGLMNLLGSHDTERFLTLCNNDTESLELALLFQMTYPGAPSIYYGDEVGMKGTKDPGCRGTMIWDEARQDLSLLHHIQRAIRLRMDHPVFRRGDFSSLVTDDKNGVYGFLRRDGREAAVVIINNSTHERIIEQPFHAAPQVTSWRRIWPDAGTESLLPLPGHSLRLAGKSAVVYEGTHRQ
jgi:glycosidase